MFSNKAAYWPQFKTNGTWLLVHPNTHLRNFKCNNEGSFDDNCLWTIFELTPVINTSWTSTILVKVLSHRLSSGSASVFCTNVFVVVCTLHICADALLECASVSRNSAASVEWAVDPEGTSPAAAASSAQQFFSIKLLDLEWQSTQLPWHQGPGWQIFWTKTPRMPVLNVLKVLMKALEQQATRLSMRTHTPK